jgi:hypothetical protein
MITNDLIEVLETNKLLETDEEFKAFHQALNSLKNEPRNPQILHRLLLLFDSPTERIDIMWTLLHFVESFDLDSYVKAVAQTTPLIEPTNRSWLNIIYTRILNHENAILLLKNLLPQLPKLTMDSINRVLIDLADKEDENPNVSEEIKNKIEMLLFS